MNTALTILVVASLAILAVVAALLQCEKRHFLHDLFWLIVVVTLPCIGVVAFGLWEGDSEAKT